MAIKTVKIEGNNKKTTSSLRTDVYNYSVNAPKNNFDLSLGMGLLKQDQANKTSQPKQKYGTVVMTGTHGMDVFDANSEPSVTTPTVSRLEKSKQESEARLATMRQNTIERRQMLAEQREQRIANQSSDPVERVKTDLSTVAVSLNKQRKYSTLSKNLNTISSQIIREGESKNSQNSKNAAWTAGGLALLSIATAFIPVAGPLISAGINAANPFITGAVGKQDYSYKSQAEKYANLSDSVIAYMESLENRDAIINNAMSDVTGTMQDMRLTYGDAFVDQFYNLMLAKSGMTSNAYSLLTGNFRTFNQGQYGTESGEAGLFDELTMGNGELFNNTYAQLERSDIEGIMNSLTQALFAGETELGLQLRGYETDIQNLMEGFITSQEASLNDAMATMTSLSSQARQENISTAEQIGSASAERASSGFRGGTSTANEALARLSGDLSRIATAAQASNLINSLRYTMKQQELNASSTAYNYRTAQKQILLRAQNATILGLNSVGRTFSEAEGLSNTQINEAVEYQNQVEEGFAEMSDAEVNAVLDSLY